ncbi:LysR family transcriptional regulator [Pseudomonas sp. DP-17]|uniref:LysR family transcriptional regulator n=1 Tax=Pseudomonas sp. DP-17 TaxID=1580486 RepID=UPI001EFB2918|nr:LysR family transcriptional regulator [Pseudomonas sp. DP-17]MCG8907517.1 LysR family transcriptional regulator [Pseudomonas sp. DP-17]
MRFSRSQPNMDGITLGRLRYLHEVALRGGVRKAADHLDVAPSSVSRQLALLEYAARMPLLTSDQGRVEPTAAGQLLLDYYAEAIARRKALAAQMTRLQDCSDNHVAVGLVQGLASGLIREALCQLEKLRPEVTVSMQLGGMDDILHCLLQDEIHSGVIYGPPSDGWPHSLRKIIGVPQPLCVIVPPGHPLTQQPQVAVKAMLPYDFALTEPGYGSRKILLQIEQEQGCVFSLRLETNHLLGLLNFVVAGLGITVLPAFAVQNELDQGRIVALPIAHPFARQAEMQLLVRSGRDLPAGAQAWQQVLLRQLRDWHQ